MRIVRLAVVLICLCSSLFITTFCLAQQRERTQCQIPSLESVSRSASFFTDEQENELGRVVAAQAQQTVRVIDDPDLTGYIGAIGHRLETHLPPTGIHFHYFLVDLPEANAFSLPGGYIYVSRKLVAFLRSEDELAAVLGHEMGHIVTRQGAIQVTRTMRRVLRIDHIQSSEIFDRYNDLLESRRRQRSGMTEDREGEQRAADQVAIIALSASGYRPEAMADFFDRFTELKGRTGSWLTDLFGTTSPNSKRLREAIKNVSEMNPACRDTVPCEAGADCKDAAEQKEEFKRWQSKLIQYNGIGHKESLHAVTMRKKLQPALRSDIQNLRFSPDGKYVLAQDESGIAVFARDENKLDRLFWIDAQNARLAHFSADSRHISFSIRSQLGSPRVEIWDVEQRTPEVYEVRDSAACIQSLLSPSGKTFMCIAVEPEVTMRGISFDLRVRNVETNELTYEKKSVYSDFSYSMAVALLSAAVTGEELRVVHAGFSPDGRYLLIGHGTNLALAIDIEMQKSISLDGNIKRLLQHEFSFMDATRIAGREEDHGQVVSFPDGNILFDNIKVGNGYLAPVTHGDFLVQRPIKGFAAGILKLRENKLSLGLKHRAADIYDDLLISERDDGLLTIQNSADGKEISTVAMFDSQLPRLRAGAISPDMKWIALSSKSRGAVWNLQTNQRVLYVRGFHSAWLDNNNNLYADFPPEDETKRSIVRVDLSATPPAFAPHEAESDVRVNQFDRVLLTLRPASKADYKHDVKIEARDVRDYNLLWSRAFSYDPPYKFYDGNTGLFVLAWPLVSSDSRKALNDDPAWHDLVRAVKDAQGVVAIEVLDTSSGTARGRILLDTGKGSFMPMTIFATADRVFILDNMNRLLVYSFDGKLQGRAFGRAAAVSPDGRVALLETGRGRLAILDPKTLTQIDELDFSAPIVMSTIVGESLAVLCADQEFFVFDLKQLGQSTSITPKGT